MSPASHVPNMDHDDHSRIAHRFVSVILWVIVTCMFVVYITSILSVILWATAKHEEETARSQWEFGIEDSMEDERERFLNEEPF